MTEEEWKGEESGGSNTDILRVVPEDKAFHFYRDLGTPIHLSARSLEEFLDALKRAEPTAIVFHVNREDFENWVRTVLGDNALADRIAALRKLDEGLAGGALKERLVSVVEARLLKLKKFASAR